MPRRVALVSSSYHPYFGGVEEHTRHTATRLLAQGHVVEVWTVDRGEHLGKRTVDGVRVRYLPAPLPASRLPNLARFALKGPAALARWSAARREFRPDVLHVQCFGPNGPYAMLTAAIGRTPLVLSAHGETFMDSDDIFGQSFLMRHELARALRKSASVTACSRFVAEDLEERFGAREVDVVPNGVVMSTPLVRATAATERSPRQVVAAGRLVQVKGFDLLLRALARASTMPRLTVLGDGPARRELTDLVRELGLSGRVDFRGRASSEEVQQAMAKADVVVVPSRKEAFGIVVLEAWASGTPVVVTSRGGPGELVVDGMTGLVVDPEDINALAAAIDRVLSEPSTGRRLAAGGLNSVQEYTWERVARDYDRIYAQLP
ncbi:MAG TPA: glycosyltransferase family 4 protein [Intrasporangium sp.]|uniref:glycosyltransferase family 4 protein n=1 Tax=Intrasporangium sp. TaxID=1925024 RepID=UPI002B4729CE|nr:glycosyltransferase family 4 protein [Intrasporangium sp.]HKX68709.1 glycosyltransferase family 4 protein [Intrasporangium sp.]